MKKIAIILVVCLSAGSVAYWAAYGMQKTKAERAAEEQARTRAILRRQAEDRREHQEREAQQRAARSVVGAPRRVAPPQAVLSVPQQIEQIEGQAANAARMTIANMGRIRENALTLLRTQLLEVERQMLERAIAQLDTARDSVLAQLAAGQARTLANPENVQVQIAQMAAIYSPQRIEQLQAEAARRAAERQVEADAVAKARDRKAKYDTANAQLDQCVTILQECTDRISRFEVDEHDDGAFITFVNTCTNPARNLMTQLFEIPEDAIKPAKLLKPQIELLLFDIEEHDYVGCAMMRKRLATAMTNENQTTGLFPAIRKVFTAIEFINFEQENMGKANRAFQQFWRMACAATGIYVDFEIDMMTEYDESESARLQIQEAGAALLAGQALDLTNFNTYRCGLVTRVLRIFGELVMCTAPEELDMPAICTGPLVSQLDLPILLGKKVSLGAGVVDDFYVRNNIASNIQKFVSNGGQQGRLSILIKPLEEICPFLAKHINTEAGKLTLDAIAKGVCDVTHQSISVESLMGNDQAILMEQAAEHQSLITGWCLLRELWTANGSQLISGGQETEIIEAEKTRIDQEIDTLVAQHFLESLGLARMFFERLRENRTRVHDMIDKKARGAGFEAEEIDQKKGRADEILRLIKRFVELGGVLHMDKPQ